MAFASRFIILVCGGTQRLAELRDPDRGRPVVPLPGVLSIFVGDDGLDKSEEGEEGADRGEETREDESEDGGEGTTGAFSRGD